MAFLTVKPKIVFFDVPGRLVDDGQDDELLEEVERLKAAAEEEQQAKEERKKKAVLKINQKNKPFILKNLKPPRAAFFC